MVNFHHAVQELKRAAEKCQLEFSPGSVECDMEFCEAIMNLIFSEQKIKSVKRPLKNVLLALQNSNPTDLESCVMRTLDKFIKAPVPDGPIQFLLENYSFLRGYFSPHAGKLIRLSNESILVDTKESNVCCSQDALCRHLKTVLEIIQFCQNHIESCFKEHGEASFHLVQVAHTCIKILRQTKEYNDEARAMAGIYLGNVLNYCAEDSNVAFIIFKMCTNIVPLPITSSALPIHGIFATLAPDLNTSVEEGDYVHLVFLLKGLFSCTRSSVFYVHLPRYGTLLHALFDVIYKASELQGELQYHGLQILKLWWAKVLCAIKQDAYVSYIQDIVSEESEFVKSTLQLVFRQWDSPISGAPAIVLDALTFLIDSQQMIRDSERFLSDLLEKLMLMPVSIKGKYNCITLLISRMGAKTILQKYPHFINNIKPLLAVNHLSPTISKTYRAIVADVAKQKNDELWRKALLPGLVDALIDRKHLIRSNATIYWLPIHLKSLRGCFNDIIKAIHDQTSSKEDVNLKYLALIATSKVARKENLIKFDDLDPDLIVSCLTNFDDSVRSEAFQVVCCNAKYSEQILPQEMDVIRKYLPLNMSSDSAVFRPQFVYCVRCLCERIRDSLYQAIKATLNSKRQQNPEDSNYVKECQKFLQFLFKTCLSSIHPEFTYQRKKTALDMYGTMLNTFFDHRKNVPVCEALFEDDNSVILMDMLRDSVPELRVTASQLLGKYFNSLPTSVLDRYNSKAVCLSRSPRAQDNESAAAIFEIVVLRSNSVDQARLLEHFVSQVQLDVALMKENMIKSSYEAPVHGWFLVLDKFICLLESDFMIQNCLLLLADLCGTACEVINLAIVKVFGYVMKPSTGRGEFYSGVSADFCEITKRIENLAIGAERKGENILLSDDHETIMAASWLCLLRGTALLATIASLLSRTSDQEKLLSNLSNSMVLVLTSCRHRGAIDGCYETFLTVCKSLLSSKVRSYQQIPQNIIKRICDSLHTVTESNVTRRSAGIPLVVEAILVAESMCKSSNLFSYVIDNITTLSSQVPMLECKDEKLDLPQVHGLYILKHLFRNAQLGSSVLRASAQVLGISIQCLSSSIWVVRNAATHLFSAVASRMLGQKNVDGSQVETLENSVTSGDFFCRYPTVGGILMKEMKKSLPSNLLPNPGLHPMLSLLSKMVYCVDDEKHIPNGLVETVTKFLDSPVYSVRCMAVKSLSGIVGDKLALVSQLLVRISDRLVNSNSLHGLLVLTQEAMKSDDRIFESKFICSTLFTMWKTESLHPINSCIVIKILKNCESFVKEKKSEILEAISVQLSSCISQVGKDEYRYQMMKTRLKLTSDESMKLLFTQHQSYRSDPSPVLKALLKQTQNYEIDDNLILCFMNEIQAGNHRVLKEMLDHNDDGAIFHSVPDTTLEQLVKTAFNMISSHTALSSQCLGLKLLSIMILVDCTPRKFCTSANSKLFESGVTAWIHHVTSRTSNCKASEPFRLSAAESIDIVGCKVFKLVLAKTKELANFVCAILSLLHDEQSIVRQHTCSFVTKLTECERNGILYHSSAAKTYCCTTVYCWQHHQCTSIQKFLKYFIDKATVTASVIETFVIEIFKLKGRTLSQEYRPVLFDIEPFNMYEEPLEIAQMVVDTFLDRGVMKIDRMLLDKISRELIGNLNATIPKSTSLVCNLIHLKCLQMAVQLPTLTVSGNINDLTSHLEQLYKDRGTHAILRQEIQCTLKICSANKF